MAAGDSALGAPRRRSGAVAWVDRALVLGSTISVPAAVLALAGVLLVVWLLVWVTGGTMRAFPHVFYVPIILGALTFGLRGALGTATVAAVLCGPLMPLDVAAGTSQPAATWMTRTVMFFIVAGVVSLALAARERVYEHQLTEEVRETLTRPGRVEVLDASLVPLVADVLAGRSFHPVYQPIYSLDDGSLLAVEALTRFDVLPYRTPDLWFAAAEHAGVGADLELAAIEAALTQATPLPEGVGLSVNISPENLSDPRLVGLVRRAAPRPVILEITEHAIIQDYDTLMVDVRSLREIGVRIAVDDAGAGISSLRHIVQLAPDIIKLDLSLTQDVASSPLRRALATSLIEFADQTGALLLVEGIETTEDLLGWRDLGAHAVQGYLVGRPGPLPAPRHIHEYLPARDVVRARREPPAAVRSVG